MSCIVSHISLGGAVLKLPPTLSVARFASSSLRTLMVNLILKFLSV